MNAASNLPAPITIVIAAAVRLYREGLATTLSAQPHLCIVGTAGTHQEAGAAVHHHRPDVVLVDVSLENALVLMRELRAGNSTSRILAFAVQDDITTILECADAGADGFVTASGSVSELVEAIARTATGELLCSPRIAAQLLRRAAHQARGQAEPAGEALTNREQQVFSLLKQGRSNKEIASALHISEATVKNHVHHVLEKLHVATRGQAAAARDPLARHSLV